MKLDRYTRARLEVALERAKKKEAEARQELRSNRAAAEACDIQNCGFGMDGLYQAVENAGKVVNELEKMLRREDAAFAEQQRLYEAQIEQYDREIECCERRIEEFKSRQKVIQHDLAILKNAENLLPD